MTPAAATTKAVSFIARSPSGQAIWRRAECSRCFREFSQYRVNPAWLKLLDVRARAAFLIACQVEDDSAFLPARCPACTRRQINPPMEIPCL